MEHGNSLFKLIHGLRFAGVGTKVRRVIHKAPETYYVITRVKLTPDQKHGEVHGKFVWNGRVAEKEEQIRSPLKKQWKLLELPDYSKFTGVAEDVIKAIPAPTSQAVRMDA